MREVAARDIVGGELVDCGGAPSLTYCYEMVILIKLHSLSLISSSLDVDETTVAYVSGVCGVLNSAVLLVLYCRDVDATAIEDMGNIDKSGWISKYHVRVVYVYARVRH